MLTYWVIGSGDEGRNLENLFYKYGTAFLSSSGIYNYDKNKERFRKEKPKVAKFMEEMEKNDIIILKNGKREMLAAGVVNSDLDFHGFSPAFEDVYGYNISNYKFVNWYIHPSKQRIFLKRSQFRGDKFSKVNKEEPQRVADEIISHNYLANNNPSSLPKEGDDYNKIDEDMLRSELEKCGLSFSAAEKLIFEIAEIKKLAEWYRSLKKDIKVSEHETVAFLILLVLQILGWHEKQLKLQLENADVVAYKMPYIKDTSTENCEFVLEAKKPTKGLGDAIDQVKRYAKETFQKHEFTS